MPKDKLNILNAKFRRDGKKLKETFLFSDLLQLEKENFESIIKANVSLPNPCFILIYFESPESWYVITSNTLLVKNTIGVDIINLSDILKINNRINQDDFINIKKEGLVNIELYLKNGDTYSFSIEKGSYSVIEGILSLLINWS